MPFIARSSSKKSLGADHRGSKQIWREPLIHFFILGLAVLGLHAFLDREPQMVDSDPYLVEVSSAEIDWIRTQFYKQMGREPTVDELRGGVNQLIREQILSREAVSLGLDEDDVIVRRRLVQKIEFLFKDLAALTEPSKKELQRYFSDHQSRYRLPAKVTFTQVYFNSDNRGVDGAKKAVQTLIRENADPGSATQLGDTLILPAVCNSCRVNDVKGQFGNAFAEAVTTLEPDAWVGPVESAYGYHAVYIHDRQEATLPDFQDVIDKVKNGWTFARREENSRKVYEEMRSRYRVRVEGMPYDLDIKG